MYLFESIGNGNDETLTLIPLLLGLKWSRAVLDEDQEDIFFNTEPEISVASCCQFVSPVEIKTCKSYGFVVSHNGEFKSAGSNLKDDGYLVKHSVDEQVAEQSEIGKIFEISSVGSEDFINLFKNDILPCKLYFYKSST
ncbi:unnamed protein product [[Candida] boidinii]|nr:unnamed protein product [[Candida] boidinii]GME95282.1 unnamed protein product [[Candida] boidinii]